MLTRRSLMSLVAVTALAVPGLAIAQSADDPPTEVVTEDPTEQPTEEQATEEATDQESEDESEERSLQQEDLEAEDREDLTVADEEEGEDEGHGEVVSALARCLPSGAELHGTGWTKGSIVSQVASTGEVTGFDGIDTVETPDDAAALCEQVRARADATDAPDRAKGRPDWAGPEGEGDEDDGDMTPSTDGDPEAEGPRGRGGPPDHARARGRG